MDLSSRDLSNQQNNPMEKDLDLINTTIKKEFIKVNKYFEGYLENADLTKANKELNRVLIF